MHDAARHRSTRRAQRLHPQSSSFIILDQPLWRGHLVSACFVPLCEATIGSQRVCMKSTAAIVILYADVHARTVLSEEPATLARSRRRERNTVAWHEKGKGRAFFVRIRIILNALRSGLSQAGSECRSASSAGKEMDVALHMHWQAREEEEEEGRIALDALWKREDEC